MSDSATFNTKSSLDRSLSPTILILDDDEIAHTGLRALLSSDDNLSQLGVVCARTAEEAFSVLSETTIHVLLLDRDLVKVPSKKKDGIELIPEFLQLVPHLQILMFTGSRETQSIVTAMKYGAFGYVTKDAEPEMLIATVQKAVQMARLQIEKNNAIRTARSASLLLTSKVPLMRRVLQQVEAVAESDRPVMLLGETGTGKTSLAKHIHEKRKELFNQKDCPFFSVNLAALPSTLVEAELFGYERGAFTGAMTSKPGFFELVNQGTLFLDEIGEISMELQKKLLTVLEEGVFYRLGSKRAMKSSFKLVCATNRNLKDLIEKRKFREDLYMRISTFCIEVPSLSLRREDIPNIIKAILPKCCEENNVFVHFDDIPKDLIRHLSSEIPPGNIRGLEQQLSRLLTFSPKDRNGHPILSGWKDLPGFEGSVGNNDRGSINLKTLIESPTNMIGPDFPGLSVVTQIFQDKIVQEAFQKLGRNHKVAAMLKMAESATSNRRKRLQGFHPDRSMGSETIGGKAYEA